ncbi:hypothetical protein KDA11_06825 [Candidatus Saccharibacteria bacterium]|nr:hypothetical protein [Candidatus Saccharibacteria bacterium]
MYASSSTIKPTSKLLMIAMGSSLMLPGCAQKPIDHAQIYRDAYTEDGQCLEGTDFDDSDKKVIIAALGDKAIRGIVVIPYDRYEKQSPIMLSFDLVASENNLLLPADKKTTKFLQSHDC